MMRLLIFILMISFSFDLDAQYSNAVWCFGDSAGINFKSNITFTTNLKSRGSCTSIADSSGNLLCYAYTRATLAGNTTLVFNGLNQSLINGTNIIGQGWYREITFIPDPNNDSLLYLFSIGITNSSLTGLFYSIINYKSNGGIGIVVNKNNQLLNYDACDGLTTIKHGNGRDWWVFFRRWDTLNNFFYKFLISPNGISTAMNQQIGSNQENGFAKMIFNHAGTKCLTTTAGGLLEYFDFDRCTGLLSNPVTIHQETNNPKHAFQFSEFSPNDSLLYVTTNNTTSYLYQFKLYVGNIWGSRIIIDSISIISEAGGELKLAPDGKIYHARAYYDGINFNYPYPDSVYNMYNTYLSVINYPDSPGIVCNFTPYSFYLGGNRVYWGLPNNPDYNLVRDSGSVCDTVWAGVSNWQLAISKSELKIFYHSGWQMLFVNAQNLKGKNAVLKIYDINGRVVFSSSNGSTTLTMTPKGYFTQDINCSSFSNGMYVVSLTTEKEVLVSKFIKD